MGKSISFLYASTRTEALPKNIRRLAGQERRLCPDASLRSVDGRLRKAASLARLACGQIRSLKYHPSDSCYAPGLPSDFGFAAFRGPSGEARRDPPSTRRRTKGMNLSAPFIDRPVATTLLTVGLALSGAIAFRFLPVSALPQVDFPTLQVSAVLPGGDPETLATS